MPIYEYECQSCGHRFERLVLRSSPPAECPSCQKGDLKQLISPCSMSSETTRQASLSTAHKKAAGIRKEKQHEDHKQLHEHFADTKSRRPLDK